MCIWPYRDTTLIFTNNKILSLNIPFYFFIFGTIVSSIFSFPFHLSIDVNDYTGPTATAMFTQGASIPSFQCASISTVQDTQLEGNHDFTATIGGVTATIGGVTTQLATVVTTIAPASSIVQINDDDGKM